jgi:hypothetical protein
VSRSCRKVLEEIKQRSTAFKAIYQSVVEKELLQKKPVSQDISQPKNPDTQLNAYEHVKDIILFGFLP